MIRAARYTSMLVLCVMSLVLIAPESQAKLPLPPLPPLLLPAPPPVVVVPGSYVYFAPAVREDLLFFQGSWYRPHEGRWYRASRYNGPWTFVPAPPRVLVTLPPGFRDRPGSSEIPHSELKRNWRNWERDRHWDRREEKHEKHEAKHEAKREHRNKKKHHDRDDDDEHHDRGGKNHDSHGRGH